ncbi:MAG TPA: VOC family protein [Nodularia sp. (in: cyanobacteria)]|nr:VOC family protein [Nodularia sp. (in: cyanobacteria)]
MSQTLFHLAFPVTDIAQTKAYYVDALGCIPGRENPQALILNLYGHQLVAHLTKETPSPQRTIYPRHFGLIFVQEQDWEELLEKAHQQNLLFRESPKNRFVDSPLEHRTFFLEDPFYNLMEFKYYRHPEAIFGSSQYSQIGDGA